MSTNGIDSFWEVLVWSFWIFIWISAIFIWFRCVFDLFSDRTLSGWGKAGWAIVLIFVPWLGALIYLIARGKSMGERSARQAAQNEQHFRSYVREVAASGTGVAEELERLTKLHQQGVLSDEELALAKQRVLQGESSGSPSPARAV
jgi:phospholipase D-like protein